MDKEDSSEQPAALPVDRTTEYLRMSSRSMRGMFKLSPVAWGALMDSNLQVMPQIFSWI